ncbi:MAG: transporter substrate-binding domain-containing protein [Ruminococcaceae bacterium]|nr:transporter substrate-binding domain-containing protein [Oscillospiraceae bacterium]
MKKIIALLMAMIMAFSLCACGGVDPAKDLENTKDKGELIIGYTIYEPMNYKDEDGKLIGFDTEFAEAVCEKLGVKPKFVVIDWDNKLMELESGNIDCIWNGMTITDKIKAGADVTKAYAKNKQVVVMNIEKVADIKSVDDLKGLKFAAEAGSAGESAVKDNKLDKDFVAVNAQTDALLEVKSGTVDACVIDITMAEAMTGEGSDYENLAISLQLTDEEYGIACRKGSTLTAEINKIMDELKADGTLDKLAEKYKKVELAF